MIAPRPTTLSDGAQTVWRRTVVAVLLGLAVYAWYAHGVSAQREMAYYAALAWISLTLWWLGALLRLAGIALRNVSASKTSGGRRDSEPGHSP